MDSRAKQRLTGAVILAALFVLLVPELLKGPRETAAPAGAPSEEGMRRYTIDLNASTPPARADNPAAQEPPVALPPVAENTQPRAAPGESAAPAGQPEEVAPVAAPSAVPAKPVPAPAAATPVPVETPRPAIAAPVERGSFVVQLGSFSSRDNATRLVRDMTAKGFAAFVAPITSGGRELYRVRVGPTRDRASAEALAAQLRRVGQSGAIVPIS
jgi:DedD protein